MNIIGAIAFAVMVVGLGFSAALLTYILWGGEGDHDGRVWSVVIDAALLACIVVAALWYWGPLAGA